MSMVQLVTTNFPTTGLLATVNPNFSIRSGYADLDVTGAGVCEVQALSAQGGDYWSGTVVQIGDAWPADQYSEGTIGVLSGANAASLLILLLRVSGTSQYQINVTSPTGTNNGNMTINAVVSGTNHSLKTFTAQPAVNDVWRAQVVGNVITVFQNGSQVTTFTDTVFSGSIAAGAPGISLYETLALADAQISLWAAGANQAATPTFSPNGGAFGPAQTVTISSTTSGGTIFYTTDGTTPTHSSSSISNGSTISVSATATVKAFVSVSDFADSAIGSASFTINGAVTTPTFSPVAGSYTSTQNVTVNNADSALPGFAMYYTLDGTTPTTGSTLYTGPITIATTKTLKVLAVATGYSNSSVGSAAYTITITTPKQSTRSK
jgi:hypothetical protein